MATTTFSGQRLSELRKRKKLTQHDLASKLRQAGFGTTQTTVSRWEDGQQPHSSVLSSLASALDVSLDELFAEDDDEESDLPVALDQMLRSYLRKLIREETQAVRS